MNETKSKEKLVKLRSTNYLEETCSNIRENYLKEKFADIVFICGSDCEKVVKGHRIVLCKTSNYLRKIIEATASVQLGFPIIPFIAIKEIPYHDLKAIVDFIYNGKITIPKTQLDSVIKSAQFLEINGLQHLGSKAEPVETNGFQKSESESESNKEQLNARSESNCSLNDESKSSTATITSTTPTITSATRTITSTTLTSTSTTTTTSSNTLLTIEGKRKSSQKNVGYSVEFTPKKKLKTYSRGEANNSLRDSDLICLSDDD